MNDDLTLLTVSEFRAFKKALNTLPRAGISRTEATAILSHGILNRRNHYREHREHVIRSVSK